MTKLNILYLIFVLTIITGFSACYKTQFSDAANETIFIRNQGADIPAHIKGNTNSKVFIVMLHGGPGDYGLNYKDNIFEEFENKYAVVYTDQRNQGNTHGHYYYEDVTMELMVEDVKVLILVLKEKYGEDIGVFLMGHSWGGTLGTAFMALNEDLVKGWIDVDGAHNWNDNDEKTASYLYEFGLTEIQKGKNTEKWNEIIDYIENIDTNNVSADDGYQLNTYAFEVEDYIEEIYVDENLVNLPAPEYNNLIGTLNDNYQEYGFDFNLLDYTAELKEITKPVLLIWGKYDFVVPSDFAFIAKDELGSTDISLFIFGHSGHSPMMNEGDLFVQTVTQFIDRLK